MEIQHLTISVSAFRLCFAMSEPRRASATEPENEATDAWTLSLLGGTSEDSYA